MRSRPTAASIQNEVFGGHLPGAAPGVAGTTPHMQGIAVNDIWDAPHHRPREFASRDLRGAGVAPPQVLLDRSKGKKSAGDVPPAGGASSPSAGTVLVCVAVVLATILGLFMLNGSASSTSPNAVSAWAKNALAAPKLGKGGKGAQVSVTGTPGLVFPQMKDVGALSEDAVLKELENKIQGEFQARLGHSHNQTHKVTADLDGHLDRVSASIAALRIKTESYDASELHENFQRESREQEKTRVERLRNAEIARAEKAASAKIAHLARLQSAEAEQNAHLEQMELAEVQLKQMQALKEQMAVMKEVEKKRDAAIVAGRAHQKEIRCTDIERNLQDMYMEIYSCRLDADLTSPNPMVEYDVADVQESQSANGETHVSLSTLAVALYLEAWATANPDKLGRKGAPSHDTMVAPRRVFAAQDHYVKEEWMAKILHPHHERHNVADAPVQADHTAPAPDLTPVPKKKGLFGFMFSPKAGPAVEPIPDAIPEVSADVEPVPDVSTEMSDDVQPVPDANPDIESVSDVGDDVSDDVGDDVITDAGADVSTDRLDFESGVGRHLLKKGKQPQPRVISHRVVRVVPVVPVVRVVPVVPVVHRNLTAYHLRAPPNRPTSPPPPRPESPPPISPPSEPPAPKPPPPLSPPPLPPAPITSTVLRYEHATKGPDTYFTVNVFGGQKAGRSDTTRKSQI